MKPRTRIAAAAAALALLAVAALVFGRGDGPAHTPVDDGTAAPALPGADTETRAAPLGDAGRRGVPDGSARAELPDGAEREQGFAGRVLDHAGTAVEGASVYLVEARLNDVLTAMVMRERGMVVPPVARAVTAADGSFRLGVRRVAEGGYEVHVVSERHPDHVVPKLTAFADRFVDLGEVRLPPAEVLTGTVTVLGSAGFPVPGATVVVRPAGIQPSFGAPPGREDGIRTTTAPNGTFRIDHVAAGLVHVSAVAPGFARVERLAVEVVHGVENRVDFELPKGMSIAGRVTDADGNPVPGAFVDARLLSSREPFEARARTDATGRYEVLGLVDGAYRVAAVAGGHVRDERQPIRAGAVDQDFALARLGSIALRVRGAGRSLPRFDAFLRGYDAEHDALRPVPGAQIERALGDDVDADGVYRLRHVAPGTYVVQVDAPGFARSFSAPCTVGVDTQDVPVEVEMRPGGTLVGRCVTAEGQPVAGVEVRTQPGFADDSPLLALLGDAVPSRVTGTSVRSSANGLFELPHLAPGNYRIRFEHPAYAPAFRPDIEVEDGRRHALDDVVLTRGAEVRGTVLLDGAPAGQVKVSVASIDDASPHAAAALLATGISDEQGRFVLDLRLPPGRYRAQAARQTLPNPILQVMDYQKTRQELVVPAGSDTVQLHFALTSD